MCFSPEVSFAASAALTGIGVATVKRVKSKKDYPLAGLAFFYAFQQLCEGVVWLTHDNNEFRPIFLTAFYGFILFAFVLWPVLAPLVVASSETDASRKKFLIALALPSLLLSTWYVYFLLNFPARVSYRGNLIYFFEINNQMPILYAYLAVVVLPGFVSTDNNIKKLAALYVATFLIADIYFRQSLISVWCFFAAIISAINYFLIPKLKQSDSPQPLEQT